MQRFWSLLMLVLLIAAPAHAEGVRAGMTRSEVEAALGKPNAALQRDDRLVLTFPKGGMIELVDDKVVEFRNVPVATPPPTPVPEIEPTPTPTPTPKPVHPAYVDPGESKSDHEKGIAMLSVALAALFRVGIMVVIIKVALGWADAHAEWGHMIIPAITDTAVHGIVALIGLKVLHLHSLYFIDELFALGALLVILLKMNQACTLPRALGVAVAAKIAGVTVGTVVGLIVLKAFA